MVLKPEIYPTHYAIKRITAVMNPWLGVVVRMGIIKECFAGFLEFNSVGGSVKLFPTPEDARTYITQQFPGTQDTLKVYCVQERAESIQITPV